jgi:hypothetical protein
MSDINEAFSRLEAVVNAAQDSTRKCRLHLQVLETWQRDWDERQQGHDKEQPAL